MSLRKRLSIATALVVLVTVSALAIAAYAIAGHELRSQVDDTLATRAEAVGFRLARRSRMVASSMKVSVSCWYTQGCTCPVVADQPMVLVMCTSIWRTPS
jgi:hypothetical protein